MATTRKLLLTDRRWLATVVRRLWRLVRGRDNAYANVAGLLMVTPALMLALMMVIGPFVWVVWTSFTHGPGGLSLDNYDRLVSSDLMSVFWHTFVIAAGSVLLDVVIALPLALLLNTPMRGRGFMRALVTLPWVVPTVAVSTAFLWLLSTNYGLLNHILVAVGLVDTPVPFLSTSVGALAAVTCVFAWKGLPLVFVILLSAVQSLPPEYREAARVDGAGRNAQIRYVVLPHMRTAVVLACVVSGVYNFAQFDLTYLLTGGGPHGATNTLPLLLYNSFQGLRDGQAAATGIVIFLAGLITLVLWSVWNRRWAHRRA